MGRGEYLNYLQLILLLISIVPGLCTKPEVVGGRVDIVDQDNQNRFGESAEIVLFKVTCFSDYQLRGSVFHLCEDGDYPNSTPSETICKSKLITKVK